MEYNNKPLWKQWWMYCATLSVVIGLLIIVFGEQNDLFLYLFMISVILFPFALILFVVNRMRNKTNKVPKIAILLAVALFTTSMVFGESSVSDNDIIASDDELEATEVIANTGMETEYKSEPESESTVDIKPKIDPELETETKPESKPDLNLDNEQYRGPELEAKSDLAPDHKEIITEQEPKPEPEAYSYQFKHTGVDLEAFIKRWNKVTEDTEFGYKLQHLKITDKSLYGFGGNWSVHRIGNWAEIELLVHDQGYVGEVYIFARPITEKQGSDLIAIVTSLVAGAFGSNIEASFKLVTDDLKLGNIDGSYHDTLYEEDNAIISVVGAPGRWSVTLEPKYEE